MTRKRKKWTFDELERMGDEIERGDFPTRPLSADEQARIDRARRGRPKEGAGSKAIQATIESGLLRRVDALVEVSGIPRSKLIARGLEIVLQTDERSEEITLHVYERFSSTDDCVEASPAPESPGVTTS